MPEEVFNEKFWDANAHVWDEAMGEGSLFQKTIVESDTLKFLAIKPGMSVLDIACGNGQMSRVMAALGAKVTAIDASQTMIKIAKSRSKQFDITYHVANVTQENGLQFLQGLEFDAILCNMALMDISTITPLFKAISQLLKVNGSFVFSITHPCFDKAVGPQITEIHENEGTLAMRQSIKIYQYLTPSQMKARAIPSLPQVHYFFHRPLEFYLGTAFAHGLVMCGLSEPAFPKTADFTEHKGWHKLCDIPVALIAKFQKASLTI